MKLIFAFITTFFLLFQSSEIESVRKSYPTAGQSKENAAKFETITEKSGTTNVAKGYKAASQIIKAKFEAGKNRKTLLTNGIKSLESAVNSAPNDIELRTIRLSIQENLPGIVGYKSKIKEDKNFIINNFSKQNSALKTYIKGFANNSKSFTATEKTSLK